MTDTNKPMGEVRALWGADRAEDALKFLSEVLANNNPRGVFLVMVHEDGKVDTRSFGKIMRHDLAWAGTQLCFEAHAA